MAGTSNSRDGVVVFDGVCVFCSGWVRFLLARDRARRFRFATMQSDPGRRLLAPHGIDPDDPVSFLLVERERAFTDSGAALRILSGLGGWWRLTGAFYAVPRFLRDAVYRFVGGGAIAGSASARDALSRRPRRPSDFSPERRVCPRCHTECENSPWRRAAARPGARRRAPSIVHKLLSRNDNSTTAPAPATTG